MGDGKQFESKRISRATCYNERNWGIFTMTNWDARYAHRDTPWDKGMAHPALVRFVTAHPLEGRILVPGCGTGHDVRAIATPSNYPVGLDISERAIRTAN